MDGQVRMANMAIIAGFSVNGVAKLHTEILKQSGAERFLRNDAGEVQQQGQTVLHRDVSLHMGNPLIADWLTDKIGSGWITDLSQIAKLKPYVDDENARREFLEIKYKNKVRLAKYIIRAPKRNRRGSPFDLRCAGKTSCMNINASF